MIRHHSTWQKAAELLLATALICKTAVYTSPTPYTPTPHRQIANEPLRAKPTHKPVETLEDKLILAEPKLRRLPHYQDIAQYAKRSARRYRVAKDTNVARDAKQLIPLVYAIITHESAGDHESISYKGAVGLMQIHGGLTDEEFEAIKNDPKENLKEGIDRLAYAVAYAKKTLHTPEMTPDVRKVALAVYNMGEGNFQKRIKRLEDQNVTLSKETVSELYPLLPYETRKYLSNTEATLTQIANSTIKKLF